MTNPHEEWGAEGINFNEFCSIGFKTSFPCLFYDLIFYLTKKNIQGHNEIWEEDEEHSPLPKNKIVPSLRRFD